MSRGTVTASHVRIPSTNNGLPVVAIPAGGFSGSTTLESVVVPSSVERIGAFAFASNPNLHTVYLQRTAAQGITAFERPSPHELVFQNGYSLVNIFVPDAASVSAYTQAARGWYASIITMGVYGGEIIADMPQLLSPMNLRVEDGVLLWDAVENSLLYVVFINTSYYYLETMTARIATTNSRDISDLIPDTYFIQVLAVNGIAFRNSQISEVFTHTVEGGCDDCGLVDCECDVECDDCGLVDCECSTAELPDFRDLDIEELLELLLEENFLLNQANWGLRQEFSISGYDQNTESVHLFIRHENMFREFVSITCDSSLYDSFSDLFTYATPTGLYSYYMGLCLCGSEPSFILLRTVQRTDLFGDCQITDKAGLVELFTERLTFALEYLKSGLQNQTITIIEMRENEIIFGKTYTGYSNGAVSSTESVVFVIYFGNLDGVYPQETS